MIIRDFLRPDILIRKNRKSIFPEISNFKDPQNKLRFTNPKSLSYREWFWFHPSAFNLIRVSVAPIAFINFAITGYMIAIMSDMKALGLLLGSFSIFFLIPTYKVIKRYQWYKYFTFFDVLVRDMN